MLKYNIWKVIIYAWAIVLIILFSSEIFAQKEYWRPIVSPRSSVDVTFGNGAYYGTTTGLNIAKRVDVNFSLMRLNKHRKYTSIAAYYTINHKNEWANLSVGVQAMSYNKEGISLSPQILSVWKISNTFGLGVDAGIGSVNFKLIVGNFRPMRQYQSNK